MFATLMRRKLAPLVMLALLLPSSITLAAKPGIEFDLVTTVAARELASSELAPGVGDEKLIAIRLQISTYVSPEMEAGFKQLMITFENSSPGFQVVDFFPKTILDT